MVNILGPYMVKSPYRVHTRFYQVEKVQTKDIRSLRLLIGTRFNNIVFFLSVISWACLRHNLGISCAYLGHILGISWVYLESILGIS